MVREPLIQFWLAPSANAPDARSPRTSLRAHRRRAVFPDRAMPFFTQFAVPGSHALFNAQTTPALDRKLAAAGVKKMKVLQNDLPIRKENQAHLPNREGAPPHTQKIKKLKRNFPAFQKKDWSRIKGY